VWWCIDASGEGRWYGRRRQCSGGVRRSADSPRGSTVEEKEWAKCDVYVWWCIDASGEGRWYGGRRQCSGGVRRSADSPRGSTVEEEEERAKCDVYVWWCIDASGEGRWYGGRRQCWGGVRACSRRRLAVQRRQVVRDARDLSTATARAQARHRRAGRTVGPLSLRASVGREIGCWWQRAK